LETASDRANLTTVREQTTRILGGQDATDSRPQRLFYKLFLPLGILANLGLGILILTGLRPESWPGWLQIASGAFCCVVAGWLSAAAWSKVYWSRSMARQVALWRQITDAFFTWLEEAPLPAEAVGHLKTSLDKVVPRPEQNPN